MKAISTAVALCAVLFCATGAHADTTPTWKSPMKILYIEAAVGGWAWVRVDGSVPTPYVCAANQASSYSYVLLDVNRGNAEGRDRAYTALNSAMLAGKSVKLRLVSSTDANGNCEIERFRILNN